MFLQQKKSIYPLADGRGFESLAKDGKRWMMGSFGIGPTQDGEIFIAYCFWKHFFSGGFELISKTSGLVYFFWKKKKN